MLIGGSGSSEALQAVRFNVDVPRLHEQPMAYIFNQWIPAVSNALTERNISRDEVDFLLALDGRLFQVCDGTVNERQDGVDAIGTGATMALGSLLTSDRWRDPKKRLMKALDVTANNVPTVSGPFLLERL